MNSLKLAGATALIFIAMQASAEVIPRSPENIPVAKSTAAAEGVVVSTEPTEPIALHDTPNRAFTFGEKLTFSIQYELIKAGTATMEVTAGPVMNGRSTLHIETKA